MTPFWIPLVAALLSSIVSLGGGYFLLTRTETFKRLSSWQPYHQQLWRTKSEVLLNLVTAASSSANEVMAYVFAEQSEMRDATTKLNEARYRFYSLFLQSGVLCTSHFHEPGIRFMENTAKAEEWKRNWLKNGIAPNDMSFRSLNELIYACRSELHIEPLQEAAHSPGHTFATFPPQYVQGPPIE